ncbi:hypothetical protein [Neobacillus sp.]|uniref:hypothetical protein n=1 Tax=Neobacillus sp. TaxID=2675273 RepID=UPI002896482F|nr:hypothetical protein [Neobacillus sp.]
MNSKQCNSCFFGKTFEHKYFDEFDKLQDKYPSDYLAFQELINEYPNASVNCPVCNSTGKIKV